MERAILHIDMNSFYASVECFHNPDIRDKPVAVCGSKEERHGIVLTANYIAKRQYGIKTGEAIWQAEQKCPDLVVVPPHYDQYIRFSELAKGIYREYSPQIEPFGLDECWVDLTGTGHSLRNSVPVADEIRERISYEMGITASVGVADNKIFAKLGSDMQKPDATTFIQDKGEITRLPVSDLLYVGRATAKKLSSMGIFTIGHLAGCNLKTLEHRLGKWGLYIWRFANGLDTSPVTEYGSQPVIKSVGNSTTTPRDLSSPEEIKITVLLLAESVAARLREQHSKCRTVQVSIRYKDLTRYERQAPLPFPSYTARTIGEAAYGLILRHKTDQPIRSIGVRAQKLVVDEYPQMSLLPEFVAEQAQEALERSIDHIRNRYGHFTLQHALMLKDIQLSKLSPKDEHTVYPVGFFH